MIGLWRIAVTFIGGTILYSAAVWIGVGCAAIPFGIAWDLLLWVTSHWPRGADGIQRIMQSHFTWGLCIGAGAAIMWHKVDDWREVAATPVFGGVTIGDDARRDQE